MSRFGNLEFEHDFTPKQSESSLVRDEGYYFQQAQDCFCRAQFEKALRNYAKVLEFNSQNAAAWTGQVQMLIELGEFKEAKVWADKGLHYFPNEPELLAANAVALARLGDTQGALSFSDAAIESQANTPYLWLSRGDVLLAARQSRAEFCFEKAMAVGGNQWIISWMAARIYAFYKHFARALKLAREALTFDPAQAVLWVEIGRCELALGLHTQARHSLEQARELDPQCESSSLLEQAENSTILDKFARRWRQWWQR